MKRLCFVALCCLCNSLAPLKPKVSKSMHIWSFYIGLFFCQCLSEGDANLLDNKKLTNNEIGYGKIKVHIPIGYGSENLVSHTAVATKHTYVHNKCEEYRYHQIWKDE